MGEHPFWAVANEPLATNSLRQKKSEKRALVSCLGRKFWIPKQSKTPTVGNIH